MSLATQQLDSVIAAKITEHKSNLSRELNDLLQTQIKALTTKYETEIEKLTNGKDAQISNLQERLAYV
jgi:hypothetical protein